MSSGTPHLDLRVGTLVVPVESADETGFRAALAEALTAAFGDRSRTPVASLSRSRVTVPLGTDLPRDVEALARAVAGELLGAVLP